MIKNEEYIGEVVSLGSEGEGVIRTQDGTAFVPYCLPGERVSFKALKVSGSVAYGKLTEVHTLSPHRAVPECPQFEKCGGCQLQHADYGLQLSFKRELVKNALKKIGGLEAEVDSTVAGERIYGYRNKLAIPVGQDAFGNTVVGFFAPRSHRIVPIEYCALQKEWSEKLISSLLLFMRKSGLKGYSEENFSGDVRQLVAREMDGRLLITVVTVRRTDLEGFAAILDDHFRQFTLLNNVNASRGNVIFGREWHVCRGEGTFTAEQDGIKYRAGANTFLQVNDDVRSLLYSATVAACAEADAVAVDLYSGGGMLTAMLAKACKAAYGVEIVPQAVACADELKHLNGLDGRMFNICGAVEEKLGQVFSQTAGLRRVIVCDPPRKGMERSVVKAVAASGADKVVLISCNPATLARDLGILCGTLTETDGQLVRLAEGVIPSSPYKIVSVTPFDMFPQTRHVETMVVLRRN